MLRLCTALSLVCVHTIAQPSCKNDEGDNVDFAYSFKYPDGWDYAYMDSAKALAMSSKSMNSTSSSISQTLAQVLSDDVIFVAWNDQAPEGRVSEAPNAHAKGIIAFNNKGGFWLTHSLPDFPSIKSADNAEDFWKDAADKYGQSFLCVNVDTSTITDKVSKVMRINRPTVYYSRFNSDAASAYPEVKAWAVDKQWEETTMTIKQEFQSVGGQDFTIYGKSGKWGEGKDLYSDLVALDVGNMVMEGWRMGVGVWGAACGKDKVFDALHVNFPNRDWKTTHDHSKWAVVQKTGDTFCLGDLNRAQGQDKRGGGTVCIHQRSIAARMRQVVAQTDSCDGSLVMV